MSQKLNKHIAGKVQQNKIRQSGSSASNLSDFPKWVPILILVFTGLLYAKALLSGITNIDDDYYFVKNYYLRDFSLQGIWAIFTSFYSFNYHPFSTISNLLEYTLFGLNPLPYHLNNVLLHLLNTWLVYLFVFRLSGKKITAIVVTILFAIHPMHVESVAWMSERKDLLYSAFYIASLLSYLNYLATGKLRVLYLNTVLFFVASLFSKSAAVTLPLIFLVIDFYKNREINFKTIAEKIPFFLLSILFGIIAIQSQKMGGAISDISISYGFVNRIFIFTGGLVSYFVYLVLPLNLSAIHYFPNMVNGLLPWYYYTSLPILVIVMWYAVKKSEIKEDKIFGFLFFIVAISVMLQLVTVGSALFAERYSYISFIGLFYIVGQWISYNIDGKHKNIIISVFALVVVLFSLQTWNRIDIWKDTDHVFSDIIEKNAGNYHNSNLYWYWGNVKKEENNNKDALEYFNTAIFIDSNNYKAYASRGTVFESLGNYKSAIPDFSKAIKLQPSVAKNYNLRGWALHEILNTTDAIADFDKAISLDTGFAEAYNNRGWLYLEKGDANKAVLDFDKAIKFDRKAIKPYFNRAALKASLGNLKEAIKDYDSLLFYHPTDSMAYYNRGIIYMNLNDTSTACKDWKKALEHGNTKATQLLNLFCNK